MNNCGHICTVTELRKHSNADRLLVATIFGSNVIVDSSVQVGARGVYFPSGLRLSDKYCQVNDLIRRKDENGNQAGGFLEAGKQNVRALKLRGEISDGLWMPLTSLSQFCDITTLHDGDEIAVLNGEEICKKYVPKKTYANPTSNKSKKRHAKKTAKIIYNFPEHIDTLQLQYYLRNFKEGDNIVITEKLEGTSGRSALLPIESTSWWKRFLHRNKKYYKDFCGSRRVTINETNVCNDGYYGTNDFRMKIHSQLVPHLSKNMEIFYEVVGWLGEGMAPIMGEVDTTCLKDKVFSRTYGEKMIFSYGCEEGKYDFYIYRICLMDDDGNIEVEYTTDQIKLWCELNGFKMVPILYRGYLTQNSEQEIYKLAQKYCDGESTLGHHWREGCVIRRENNAAKFDVYKHKNDSYKIMKNLATNNLNNVDNISEDLLEELV